jgi:hypothetical protein
MAFPWKTRAWTLAGALTLTNHEAARNREARLMNDTRIVVVDLRIPFFRLVFFFVKAVLATIPAALILSAIFALLLVILHSVSRMLGGSGTLESILRQLGL